MAIKKISEFVSGAPTSADKILFEQNEKGKSTTIGDAVNTCSLSYGEIMETSDLTGKIASAEALKTLNDSSFCEHVITESSGEYWRFASGLQICILNKDLGNPTFKSWESLYKYNIPSIDFPVPFVSTPYVAVITTSALSTWGAVTGDFPVSMTSWNNMMLIRTTASSYSVIINLIAIGRWK